MAEPDLSISYNDLVTDLAEFLFGKTSSNDLETEESYRVQRAIDVGLRQVLGRHRWSFLKPATTLSTVASTWQYTMADDFGGVENDITFAVGTGYPALKKTSERNILRMRAEADLETRPRFYSIRPKAHDFANGHRYEMILYPTPDKVYVLNYAFRKNISKLNSTTRLYPPGGAFMSEAYRSACRAAAERMFNDGPGVEAQLAEKEIELAWQQDLAFSTGDVLGRNDDGSLDDEDMLRPRDLGLAQYNGYPS